MVENIIHNYQKRRQLITKMVDEMDVLSTPASTHREEYFRLTIRVSFSILDALSHCIRQDLRELAALKGVNFSASIPGAKEIFDLRVCTKSGVEEIVDYKNHPLKCGLNAANKFIRWLKEEFKDLDIKPLPILDSFPAGFKTAVNLRNQLTHPKDISSYDLKCEELEAVEEVMRWTQQLMREVGNGFIRENDLIVGGLSLEIAVSSGYPKKPIPRNPRGRTTKKGLPDRVPPSKEKE